MTGRVIGAGIFAAWGSGIFLVAANMAGPLSPLVVLIGLTMPAAVAAGWLLLVAYLTRNDQPRPAPKRAPAVTRPQLTSRGAR